MNNYPKKYMSITELTELGFARDTLKRWAHTKGAPVIRTGSSKRSKILFNTVKLDDWAKKRFAV